MDELARARARVGRVLRRLVVGLALVLVGGELFGRWLDSRSPGDVGMADAMVDKGDYWVMRPNATLVMNDRYGDRTYTFNRYGFRDRDHREGAAPGCRVLFLGDSITYGLSVHEQETFVRRIEARLRAEGSSCPRYDVVSLALPGYYPSDELAALREVGLRYAPDLIVLQLYMNDLPAPQTRETLGKVKTGWLVLEEALFEHSALARRTRQGVARLGYLLFHAPRRAWFPETLSAAEASRMLALLEQHEDAEIVGLRNIRKIHELAAAHGIAVLQWISPNEVQLYRPDFDAINRRIAAFSARHGYDHHDPLEALRADPDREALMADGLHYSATGHRAVAAWLYPQIEARLAALRGPAGVAGESASAANRAP